MKSHLGRDDHVAGTRTRLRLECVDEWLPGRNVLHAREEAADVHHADLADADAELEHRTHLLLRVLLLDDLQRSLDNMNVTIIKYFRLWERIGHPEWHVHLVCQEGDGTDILTQYHSEWQMMTVSDMLKGKICVPLILCSRT